MVGWIKAVTCDNVADATFDQGCDQAQRPESDSNMIHMWTLTEGRLGRDHGSAATTAGYRPLWGAVVTPRVAPGGAPAPLDGPCSPLRATLSQDPRARVHRRTPRRRASAGLLVALRPNYVDYVSTYLYASTKSLHPPSPTEQAIS